MAVHRENTEKPILVWFPKNSFVQKANNFDILFARNRIKIVKKTIKYEFFTRILLNEESL